MGWEDSLEKEMPAHLNTFAWRIPWTEEPGGLQSRSCKELDTTERLTHDTWLVAQWLRIHLPVQETWVWSLIQEDLTCHRAIKLVHHNYWTCALEPGGRNYSAHMLQVLKPCTLESKRSATREATATRSPYITTREWLPLTATSEEPVQQQRPSTAKKLLLKITMSW